MKTNQKRDMVSCASQAIRESIEVLDASGLAVDEVYLEEGRDIKLQADLLLSRELTGRLKAATGLACLSEEDIASHDLSTDGEPVWIVDPLDGSMNFSRGLPLYCISIAVWWKGEPMVGVIHDVARRKTMVGYDGCAEVDGASIKVRREKDPAKAILATGFPVLTDTSSKATGWFLCFADAFKKVRMLGSAALSMAWVAQGKLDAYFEKDIMIWDIAAGAALVRAAGGVCDIRPGRFPLSRDVLAANVELASGMKEFLGWK